MQQQQTRTNLLPHLIIAVALVLIDVVLGLGLGAMIGLIAVIVALIAACGRLRDGRGELTNAPRVVAVYLAVVLTSVGLLGFEARLAERNAAPLIAACNRFKAERQRYPSQLSGLVPDFIPTVPRARFALVANEFRYEPNRPSLYFVGMFHGIFYYDFQTSRWGANE